MMASGAQPVMAHGMPQSVIIEVAKRKECEKGARIREAEKRIWERPHAVVRLGRYFVRVSLLTLKRRLREAGLESWVGESTIMGRTMDPMKDIRVKRTRAEEPLRAISPRTSEDLVSSAAV